MEEIYHVYNKSIAGFKIFNNNDDFLRMIRVISYYQREKPQIRFSEFIELYDIKYAHIYKNLEKEKLIEIIAYCVMPTHLHLFLKQLKENGISVFISNVLNSYTRYFNVKYKRKGPLWEGRSKKVLVETDEQLLHLTRYIHLNPVTSYLVERPEDWPFSSYREYMGLVHDDERICEFKDLLDINPISYKKFVEDGIFYQRELAKVKASLTSPSPRRWHLVGGTS